MSSRYKPSQAKHREMPVQTFPDVAYFLHYSISTVARYLFGELLQTLKASVDFLFNLSTQAF